MIAGKCAQRTTSHDLQADGAFLFTAFAFYTTYFDSKVSIRRVRSPLLRSDTPSLVAILPVLHLAGLAAIVRCFTGPTSESSSTCTAVGALFGAWIGRLFLVVHFHSPKVIYSRL